jgi:uncharacterized protein YifE (UPF0438 family)
MRTTVKNSSDRRIGEPPKFQIDCFPFIFSLEELEVLENKGFVMKALAEGKRAPVTSDEESFVSYLSGQKKAITIMETAWHKYSNRQKLEAALLETEEVYHEYMKLRQS